MAKTFQAPCLQNVNNLICKLDDSMSSLQLAWTAGVDDGVLKSFWATSTNSSDLLLRVTRNIGGSGTDDIIATVSIPANSGDDGASEAVSIMDYLPCSLDANGNYVLWCLAGTTIKVVTTAAIGSGHFVYCQGDGFDF